jgi:putative transposase
VFQDERAFLGVTSSPAFVREPQGHGCAERLIRTRKENLLWITTFDTVEGLRVALLECQCRDNETWLIGRHRDNTPMQV